MKKWIPVIALLLILTGCTQVDFETMSDEYVQSDLPAAHTVILALPQEATATVMEADDAGKLYLCDGYTVSVQTLTGGDLDATLRKITGFSRDALTVMETKQGNFKRYESVWSAAGETQDQIGRVVILDDGNFHYAVSVMADYTTAGDLADTWQEILSSVSLDIA